MARSKAELTDGLDEDFQKVIKELQDLFVRGATAFRGRATHTYGIAARGTARIIVPFDFPENDFFRFGKEYSLVLRHSTPGPEEDDRTLDGGATSLKFLDKKRSDDNAGLHDVMMNTGRILFVTSAREFNTMVHTPPTDLEKRKKLVTDGVVHDEILTEGYRTGSFTEFHYHSQICYEMNDKHYLRYRMIPGDRGLERGWFPKSIRSQGRTTAPAWTDDARSHDFLRRDFETRVKHLGVDYLLQAQVRPMDVNDDPWTSRQNRLDVETGYEPDALDPSKLWDERYYPWMDVALLRVDSILSDAEADQLSFDANRTDASINLPLATKKPYSLPHSQADRFASFGHSRALVYYLARAARAAAPQPHVN